MSRRDRFNRRGDTAHPSGNAFAVGFEGDFADDAFIRPMKDYRNMSKAELLKHIRKLRSQYVRRTKAQKQKAASELHDREAQLHAILETAVEGIMTIDERGIIETVNLAAENIFGYKAAEIIGKNVSILMPSPHRENHDSYLKNYCHTGIAKIIGIGREVAGRRKDGSLFPMELAVSEVKLAGRRTFTGFIRDISKRKSAETALRENEERYRALVISSPDALFINRNNRVVFVNAAGLKMFRADSIDQLLNRPILDLFHPQYHDVIRKRTAQMHAGHGVPLIEEKIIRLDGTPLDVEVAASPFEDSNGKAIQVVLRDISERKKAEEALLHYMAIVESSQDAIVGKTLEGYITSWNRGAENIFGYSRDEVIGKHISILFVPDRPDEEPHILAKIRSGQSVPPFETLRRRKDGRIINISVTMSPIRDAEGKIIGVSKVARDITERKQLEKAIVDISDREQRRIGYDLHDGLCQHLAGIELMSEVLAQKLEKKHRQFAARAADISKNVRETIAQTRALARGLSPVTLETDGLMSALRELAGNTERMFRVECHFDCDPEVPVYSHASATHLFRVAQEAVSNAIKHGKAKKIRIQLRGDPGRVYLGITDNGSGMPAELPKSKGMGLRIMQSRASMIGGTLTIEKNPRGGITVICAAPNSAADKTERHGIEK